MAKELERPDLTFQEGEEKVSVFINSEVKKKEKEEKTFVISEDKLETIRSMHAHGLRYEDIAKIEEISPEIFRRMVDSIPQLKTALVQGRAMAKRNILGSLYDSLMKDKNPQAIFQWLFMFGGEKTPNRMSLTDKAGEPMPAHRLKPEDRLKAIVHLNKLLVKGGVLSKKQEVEITEKNLEEFHRVQNNKNTIRRILSKGKEESEEEDEDV